MPTVSDMQSALIEGNSTLDGLKELTLDQSIPFTQYIRKVLPLDGFVFWLRTATINVSGSLHVETDKRQLEDETIAVNRVVFTAAEEIQAFNSVSPNTIWVGQYATIRFAFTRRTAFFDAAGIYHYAGEAVYPALANILVDVGSELSDAELVVSNSLPAWLTLFDYRPEWLAPLNPGIVLYPSFAIPDNLPPPYGAVHILPEQTTGLQAAPRFDNHTTHNQLASDMVHVTLYGATNSMALDFLDLVNRYSYDMDVIGIMNIPIVRDEKRTQAELGILAMKKTIEFQVSYYQTRINNIARQLILHAAATIIPVDP